MARTRIVLLALFIAGCAVAPVEQPADPPPYGPAVIARFPAPAARYDTPAFAPGRQEFTTNEELSGALRTLAERGQARLLGLGASQGGVPLEALLFTRLQDATPGAVAADARPMVLIVGQQHGDEPASGEAPLVIARELAGGRLAELLDRIHVIVLPRANPDGAAAGRRLTANGIDANRDHLLLRTPEAQAIAQLARDFRPAVVVDVHEYTVVGRYLEKYNAVQRFDLLVQYATTANLPPALTRMAETAFRQPLVEALEREGLTSEWYYTTSIARDDKRISMGGVQPDTGRNVNGLKNTISLLLEARGVGIGRWHFTRRVHTHVVALRSVLHSAARHADELMALRRGIEAQVGAQACSGEAVVLAAQTPTQRELLFIDPDSGADKPLHVDWNSSLELRPVRTRARPCGYWLSADAADAVQRLRRLGVVVQRFDAAATLQAQGWRETSRTESARADVRGTIADAQPIANVSVAVEPKPLVAPAGSYYVPLDQPLAHLVLAALEPDTQNSYFANRLLDALDHAARVIAPPGVRLSSSP